jgi:phenylacetic acid degradation protein
MHHVEIGEECVVGALCFLPAEAKIPARKLVIGNPGRVTGDVGQAMVDWKSEGTGLYRALTKRLHDSLRETEPLRKAPENMERQAKVFRSWKETLRKR